MEEKKKPTVIVIPATKSGCFTIEGYTEKDQYVCRCKCGKVHNFSHAFFLGLKRKRTCKDENCGQSVGSYSRQKHLTYDMDFTYRLAAP